MVEAAPEGFGLTLLGTGQRSLSVPWDQSTPLPPFQLAATLTGQTGFHNHNLLAYGLDAVPVSPAGVYGIFARLTSNGYEPSNPFLIAINHGVAYNDVLGAAHMINRFAFLPGDYNHDDVVDEDDYPIWQSLYGDALEDYELADGNGNGIIDAADYTVWRNNLGAAVGSGATAEGGADVPEPSVEVAATCFLVALVLHRCTRKR
jgi:hypothetical protein